MSSRNLHFDFDSSTYFNVTVMLFFHPLSILCRGSKICRLGFCLTIFRCCFKNGGMILKIYNRKLDLGMNPEGILVETVFTGSLSLHP